MPGTVISLQCVDSSNEFVVVTVDTELNRVVDVSRTLPEFLARRLLRSMGKTEEDIDAMVASACSGLRNE